MIKRLLAVTPLAILLSTSIAMGANPMHGLFMVVKGPVKVISANKQATDAKVGLKIVEGDTVQTGADAVAKVVMADRNVISLTPNSQIVIAKYENDASSGKKNVELNLLQGKVRNNVEQTYDGEKSKFIIKTPTAVAGVRGTQFLAGYNPQTKLTSIVTFKGAVTLASIGPGGVVGAPVLVKKGQMTQAAPDMAPETPKALPNDEIKKIDGESTASLGTKESSGGETKRETASEAPPVSEAAPSMVDNKDIDMGIATEIKDVRAPTMAPAPAPVATPPPSKTTENLVKDIIRDSSGKTRVNVRPVPKN